MIHFNTYYNVDLKFSVYSRFYLNNITLNLKIVCSSYDPYFVHIVLKGNMRQGPDVRYEAVLICSIYLACLNCMAMNNLETGATTTYTISVYFVLCTQFFIYR